ncbi:MAG: 4Fe-4S dicluster domain-containing protein [Gammaproteobacteria bacterium]|nr:4Fe-4S dicluster domain-containing protein [Gammaproteobacteria bacterium]
MSIELGAEDAEFTPLAPRASPTAVIERIEAAGIVGMGGGAYPTARKIREAIAADADWVIGNGMASEPGVTADVTLLRDHADEVTAGLEIVARCTGAAHTALAVPIDSDVPGATPVGLAYPAGDEKRLVAHLTGRTVPATGYASDVGVLVLNVSTLFAIHDAVIRGRALRQRMVTVAGTDQWVAIGTPLADLPLAEDATDGYRIQGELTGRDVAGDAVIAPSTFSVDEPRPASWACIRCGWCASACPEGLAPERLHRAFEADAEDATVFDCIECGACTAACPSRLDLVNEFRAIKTRIRREERAMEQAERARQRSAARTERLARAADERDRHRAERMNKPRQW